MNEEEFGEAILELAKVPVQELARGLTGLLVALNHEKAQAQKAMRTAVTEQDVNDAALAMSYWSGAEYVAEKLVDIIHSSVPA